LIYRPILGGFFVLCIILMIGAFAWGVVGFALDGLETHRTEAVTEAEVARTEQVQVEATQAATLGEQEIELAGLEVQIIEARADLVEIQGFVDSNMALVGASVRALDSNTQIVRETVDRQAELVRREEAQEDRGAFIDVVWDKFGAVLSIGVAVLAYAIGKQG